MMAAAIFKSPELMLEKAEADSLAAAISEVEKFYSVTLSPEARAWLGLTAVAAMIYGPRAWMIMKRRKADKGGKLPAPRKATASPAAESSAPEIVTTGEGAPPPRDFGATDFGF